MKTLILGLGNTILTDDGVGIYVARRIRELLQVPIPGLQVTSHESQVSIQEASVGGFNFIDLLTGYEHALIIDAIHTKDGTPGEFYELDLRALKPSVRISSLHGIDLATACQMAKGMGISFPKDLRIFVMEVEDEFTFGETCTPKVAANIDKMAKSIISHLTASLSPRR